MLPMLAMTAISGGLSLMSGIGGRNSAKKQARLQQAENDRVRGWNNEQTWATNEWNYGVAQGLLNTPTERTSSQRGGVDVDRMMADADRAGFNPVTWLQSGAMAHYAFSDNYESETNPVEAYRMMLRTPNLQSASTIGKIPDAMEIVGDAGQAALNTFRSEYAREDSQAFQREQLGTQLAAIQASRNVPGFGSIPRETTSGSRSVVASPLLSGISADGGKTLNAEQKLAGAEIEKTSVTPYPFGRRSFVQNDVRWPDASVVQNVWGEPAEIPYFFAKSSNDFMYSTSKAAGIYGGRGIGYYDLMDSMTAQNAMTRDRIGSPRPWLGSFIDGWNGLKTNNFLRNPGAQPWLGSGM